MKLLVLPGRSVSPAQAAEPPCQSIHDDSLRPPRRGRAARAAPATRIAARPHPRHAAAPALAPPMRPSRGHRSIPRTGAHALSRSRQRRGRVPGDETTRERRCTCNAHTKARENAELYPAAGCGAVSKGETSRSCNRRAYCGWKRGTRCANWHPSPVGCLLLPPPPPTTSLSLDCPARRGDHDECALGSAAEAATASASAGSSWPGWVPPRSPSAATC
eukprot:351226-Chlamydomonas_euryale.AAC.7